MFALLQLCPFNLLMFIKFVDIYVNFVFTIFLVHVFANLNEPCGLVDLGPTLVNGYRRRSLR